MSLPFSREQFLQVFIAYNNAIWPSQIFLNLLALGVILATFSRYKNKDRFISTAMGFLWLWTGFVYHLKFFNVINPAASGFAILSILQGVLFIVLALKNKVAYNAVSGCREAVGIGMVVYALILYPLIGWSIGHRFPASPTFGAPCPTTIFTFAILLWEVRLPRHILILPGIWSLIGFTAALTMGIYEDIGLLLAGVLAITLILTK